MTEDRLAKIQEQCKKLGFHFNLDEISIRDNPYSDKLRICFGVPLTEEASNAIKEAAEITHPGTVLIVSELVIPKSAQPRREGDEI